MWRTRHRAYRVRANWMERSAARRRTLTLLLLAGALAIAGCGVTSTRITTSPTGTAVPTATAEQASLPIDCPDPSRPTILPGASLALPPASGPVGTQVTVDITGLQPGCHLWLGMQGAPALVETHGTPRAAPF